MSRCLEVVVAAVVLMSACADVTLIEDVAYDERYKGETLLDVYLPSGDRADRPAYLLIHGGGWRWGNKEATRDRAYRIAHAGYVVFAMNYRLTPRGAYPNAIQDCFCALGFLQANAAEYGVDPMRIVAGGYSAGGHLASLLGVAPARGDFEPDCGYEPTARLAGVIASDAPQDLVDLPDVFPVDEFVKNDEQALAASPLVYVDASDPPFLLIHGTDDWIVPIEHSRRMRRELTRVGVEARLLEMRGGHHVANPDGSLVDSAFGTAVMDDPEGWAAVMDFLSRATSP